MPIDIVKDDTTTVRVVFQAQWDWEEFYKTNNQIVSFLEQSDTTSNLVIDLRKTTALPDHMVYHLSRITYLNHSQLDRIVIVGATLFQEMVFKMLISLMPTLKDRIGFVNTLDDEPKYV